MSVYCILEVRYCFTSVAVYMEMESVDKNLTDVSYLTAFLSALLVKLRLIEKDREHGKEQCALSQYHLMYVGMSLRECLCECVCLTVIFGF